MTGMVSKSVQADAIDPEVELAVNVLRAALAGVPEAKRQLAASRLVEILAPPKPPPQRGKAVLQNVITLFKETDRTDWSAGEVVAAVKEKQQVEPKKVYSALTYLKDMKIIQRVGYGRYRLANGGLLITHERGGN